jgi:glycosyltransferase involved in cell wall biosynthesis
MSYTPADLNEGRERMFCSLRFRNFARNTCSLDLSWWARIDMLPDGSTLGEDFRVRHIGANFLDRVVFGGEVSDAQLEERLQWCDIFVAPSRYESFGLVFLEAMMFAKPVVGCLAGGMSEVIEEGTTGLLAEPGDVASLVSTVGALLEDATKRREFGRAGRERYLRLYTGEALIERTLKFYRETLSRRSEASTRSESRRSERPDAERVARFEQTHVHKLAPASLAQR